MSALPPNGWYFAWVASHCRATAASPDAAAALLANEDIAVEVWAATHDELTECTKRLVRTCRTPKFPNEHADAIGTELVVLRGERERAGFMSPMVPTGPGDCPERCERGLLIAPMAHLVKAGLTGRDLARQTIAVLCDQCQAGKAEIVAQDRVERFASPTKEEAWKKKKLLTRDQYLTRTNGIDGIGVLRQYEADVQAMLRADRGESYKTEFPALAAMLAGSVRMPFKERPRGPDRITN